MKGNNNKRFNKCQKFCTWYLWYNTNYLKKKILILCLCTTLQQLFWMCRYIMTIMLPCKTDIPIVCVIVIYIKSEQTNQQKDSNMTGSPVSRRVIWELGKSLRKEKIVLLGEAEHRPVVLSPTAQMFGSAKLGQTLATLMLFYHLLVC